MGSSPSAEPGRDSAHLFTTSAFVRDGNDRRDLRSVDYQSVLRGVWAYRSRVDRYTLIRAALLIHPDGAYASRISAALLWDFPVPEHAFVHITARTPEDRRYRPQIKSHVTKRRRRLVKIRGIPTTDAITTFIECAGMLGLVDLVVMGDALLKRCGITAAQLRDACSRSTDYYAGLARLAASYVRDRVDSPMETRLRMLIVLAGLPEPEVGVRLFNDDGTWRRRFDLCYRRIKLVVEYEGRHHAEDIGQWATDLERNDELDEDGYHVIHVAAEGVFKRPEYTLQRIRRRLLLLGWKDVPPIDPTWRQYFDA